MLKKFYSHMHSNTADGNTEGSEIWRLQALAPIRVYDQIFIIIKGGGGDTRETS